MRSLTDTSEILVDIKEFFNKLKSLEKITQIPCPNEVDVDKCGRSIYFEWYRVIEPPHIETLKIDFNGSSQVKLTADYESLGIDIEQNLPINEDFPELILTHLKRFKTPIKKKRYK